MGFGTLFFGYFLLLNITYYSFTDLIAALIMAMGLYKLSSVNRPFRNGLIAAFVFAGLGLVELVCGTLDMFLSVTLPSELLSVTSVSRYFVIAVLTLFIFKGIDEVAREVGLSELSRRARISMPIALFIYTASAVLDIPILESGVNVRFFAISSAIILICVPPTIPRERIPRRDFAFTRRSSFSIQMEDLNSFAFWMKNVAGRA